MEKKEKKITSAMVTSWYPDLPWNTTKPGPEKDKAGKPIPVPIPDAERTVAEITWPTVEEFDRITSGKSATTVMFMALTKACCTKIERFVFHGESAENGAELLAIRSPGAKRARELAINIGSYIFKESVVTEEDEKN